MGNINIQGLSLLREYDRFVCKAVYSGSDISEFMVYNDFILKMYNEAPIATESLMGHSGIADDDKRIILDFCQGNTRLSTCKDVLYKFFGVLVSNQDMLNYMLDLRRDNDVCLYMLDDISRDIKDRLIEMNIATATELTRHLVSTKVKPFGISSRSMYKLFESIRGVSKTYDVQYIRQCYESITARADTGISIPEINFYQGISSYDLYFLYTICRKIDVYNLNDAIAIIHAFRRFISEDMVDKLLNCYGKLIPMDIKKFTRSMCQIDRYISEQKGMKISQFQSLVVRSAYFVSKIFDAKKIREILVKQRYGEDKLCFDNISEEKVNMFRERLPKCNVFEFQEYIRKNGRLPVDLTSKELYLLFSGFVPDKMDRYEKWFETFIVEKDGYPMYVLS